MHSYVYFSAVNMASDVHEEVVWQLKEAGFSKADSECIVDKYVAASAEEDKRYLCWKNSRFFCFLNITFYLKSHVVYFACVVGSLKRPLESPTQKPGC